jgi:hypothetical protein
MGEQEGAEWSARARMHAATSFPTGTILVPQFQTASALHQSSSNVSPHPAQTVDEDGMERLSFRLALFF